MSLSLFRLLSPRLHVLFCLGSPRRAYLVTAFLFRFLGDEASAELAGVHLYTAVVICTIEQDKGIPASVVCSLALFVAPSVPARRDMKDQRRGGLFAMPVCLVQAQPRQLIVGRTPRAMSSITRSILFVAKTPYVLWITKRLCIFSCEWPTVPLVFHSLRLDGWFPCGT